MTREAVCQRVWPWRGLDQAPSTLVHRGVVDGDKALLAEPAGPGLPVTLVASADARVVDRQVREISPARLDEPVPRPVAQETAP